MKHRVVVVGKGGCRWADEAVADYTKRMRRFGGIDEVAVRSETFRGDVETVRTKEAERLLARVEARDRLIVLDERGVDLDTSGFVDLVQQCRMGGVPRMTFAIGGAYGHAPSTRDRAWRVVRVSSLVLNHELARVVLYEQIYRAWTIIQGIPYHH